MASVMAAARMRARQVRPYGLAFAALSAVRKYLVRPHLRQFAVWVSLAFMATAYGNKLMHHNRFVATNCGII